MSWLGGCSTGIVAFIVPFAFVLNQKLLVVITGLQIEVVIDLIFAFLTCLSLAFSAQGWLLRDISIFQRGILFLTSLIMLSSNNLLCLAGAVVLFALYILNKKLVKTKGMKYNKRGEENMRVIVIGGVAAGASVAAKARI